MGPEANLIQIISMASLEACLLDGDCRSCSVEISMNHPRLHHPSAGWAELDSYSGIPGTMHCSLAWSASSDSKQGGSILDMSSSGCARGIPGDTSGEMLA